MAKMLKLEDLKTKDDIEELDGMYDLIIPPGVPSSIIFDLVEDFDLEPLSRDLNVHIVETDVRELLVLRGNLETIQEAQQFLHDELDAWINGDD